VRGSTDEPEARGATGAREEVTVGIDGARVGTSVDSKDTITLGVGTAQALPFTTVLQVTQVTCAV
jgi:hypothetical protein